LKGDVIAMIHILCVFSNNAMDPPLFLITRYVLICVRPGFVWNKRLCDDLVHESFGSVLSVVRMQCADRICLHRNAVI